MGRTNDAQLLVLSVLADGPLHGYAINAAIETMTGQRLGPGSLYGALARLTRQALIEPVAGEGRQQPVRLTQQGHALLAREARSMAKFSRHVFETTTPERTGYLDRVAATEAGRSYKRIALDALDIRPGQTIVDLGCGPGTDLATLAAASPAGAVIGVDADRTMLDQARQRTAGLRPVHVTLADLHELPLAGHSADRARTDRVLQHVRDPAAALAEIRRVLRPGGRLVMAEPDWDSLAVDHPDIDVARAYTRHIGDNIVRNAVIGRQLPRLATQAGFAVAGVTPVTSTFRDVGTADRILGLERNTQRAVAAGYLSADAARDWLDHLATQPFFAAVTLYVVLADVM